MKKNKSIDTLKRDLQISSIFTLLLAAVYILFGIATILISVFFDNFVEAIKSDVSVAFAEMLSTLGKVNLVLLYFWAFIVIVPFLAGNIALTIRANKLVREIEQVDNHIYLEVALNAFIFVALFIAFFAAIVISYFSFHIENLWFMFIPLIATVPLYLLGIAFKIHSYLAAKSLLISQNNH